MNLGQWLTSLTAKDHLILLLLYCCCIYLSKITLEAAIDYYNIKKQHNKFRVKYRITPISLLSLAFIYSLFFYQILSEMFAFIP